MLKGRDLLNISDFNVEELDEIFDLAMDIIDSPQDYIHVCDGKLLCSLFFEPSTRTRLSFEAAMNRLGGRVIGFSEAGSSSVAKGESLADTIRTTSLYGDIVVMRHPKEGAAIHAQKTSEVSVINAGDGGHQHPTQTLTDLLTIKVAKKRFDNLTLGLCGDLKFGRTVHSLIEAMSRYENTKFYMISPKELELPDYIKDQLKRKNISFEEVENIEDVIDKLDILYMTRVQKERFFNEEDYIRLKDFYILDKKKLEKAKKDAIVLHPLPRVNEIKTEVDQDERAWYFKQAKYGMYVRMALICKLLGVK